MLEGVMSVETLKSGCHKWKRILLGYVKLKSSLSRSGKKMQLLGSGENLTSDLLFRQKVSKYCTSNTNLTKIKFINSWPSNVKFASSQPNTLICLSSA